MYIYVLKLIKHECSCLVYSRLGGRLNTTAGSFFYGSGDVPPDRTVEGGNQRKRRSND